MAINSVHFFTFYLDEKITIEELCNKIFNNSNNNNDKFVLNDYSDNILDGCYIFYFNTKEIMYNEVTDSIEESIIRKNVIVPFCIDINKETLDIWSSNSSINKLLSKLGILLDHKVIIEPIKIDLKKIINELQTNDIKICNVKISDYPLEKDIIANCTLNLKNYGNSAEVLKKYSKNIVKVTLLITCGEENVTTIIHKTGSVVIYKMKDEISSEILEIIKSICIG